MFDPMQFQFSPQAEPFVQDPYAPKPQQFMLGTMSPQQQDQQKQQDALVEALRAMSGGNQQSMVPAQAGRVTSTGAATAGMDAGAIGGALGKAFA
jgi:fructose-specific phosphotransferase system IIC component